MNDALRRMLPVARGRSSRRLISAQLLLALLVTVIIGSAVVSYDRMVTGDAEGQMRNTADLAEVFLNQQNADVAGVITSVTKAGDVTTALEHPELTGSQAVIARILNTLSASGSQISAVTVTDAAGRVILAVPERVQPGYDLSDRLWFRQARLTRSFSISPVFESQIQMGAYLTTISVPIRVDGDPAGRLLGVVAVVRELDGYQEFVDAYAKSRGVRLSVIDGTGAVVADGSAAAGLSPSTSLSRRIAIGRTLLAAHHGEIMAVSDGSSGGADASATGDDWRVVAQEPADTVLGPALLFRAVAVIAGGLILIATFLITGIRGRAALARRDAARHLEQSQARIRDLADSSPNLLYRITAEGRVIFASRASETLLGRTVEELVGQDLIAMLEPEGGPDLRDRLAGVLENGGMQTFVARTTLPDGDRRIVEGSFRLGQTSDVTEVWGALRDITDRRSARDQMEQLFQLSEDFMAVVDHDGLLVQTNPVWTAAFGLGPQQLAGTRFESRFQPEDHARVATELARLSGEQTVATFETRYQRDGATRTLLWTAGADPLRQLIYAVGRDISDHKELQRALAETRDQALEASRLKSEFVATMSHEIRTPMNGVIGLTDLLLGTRLDATQRRYVEGVRTAGDALLSVINDILDFSKIEAGRLVLDNVDFRLEDVVDDVVTLVRQSSSAKGLELSVEYEPGVPFALNGDPGRLRQILLNLAHNAVKFTAEGSVGLRIEPGAPRSDGGVPVIFKVIDTGIGLEESRLEELFEPFRQADEGVARSYGGTGLGLSICRRLADLMGGRITAVSELGNGATFAAELVFAPAADWGRSVRGSDARGLAVLVVDDNEVNRLVMITQLNRWGMRPVAAESAAEAMEVLTRRSAPAGGYDLAVIDMHMPKTNGLALVRQLRAIPALAKLPVILLTSDETVDQDTALQHGISARLTKPVQQSALFDALTRVGLPSAGTTVESGPPALAALAATPRPAAIPAGSCSGSGLPGAADPAGAASGPLPAGSAGDDLTALLPPGAQVGRPPLSSIVGGARGNTPLVDAFTGRPVERQAVADQPVAAGPGRGPERSGSIQVSPRDTGYQLLLVEDNDINQTVALGILSQLGYRVDVAADGIQAVTMAGQHAYDAILMDCQMPRLDGYAATVELRKRPATSNTPIIAMTAATFAADRQRCFDSGMDDFIAKPVRAATLQATLNRWLRDRENASEHTALPAQPGRAAAGLSSSIISSSPETIVMERIPSQGGRTDAASSPSVAAESATSTSETSPQGTSKPVTSERETSKTPAPEPGMADMRERMAELLGEGSEIEVELVREIVASFLGRSVDLLQRLTLAVAADDADAAYLHSHTLAGAGLNLGTVRVVEISRQIEADAKAGRPALSVPRLVELEVALDEARVLLREYAATLPDPVPAGAPPHSPS